MYESYAQFLDIREDDLSLVKTEDDFFILTVESSVVTGSVMVAFFRFFKLACVPFVFKTSSLDSAVILDIHLMSGNCKLKIE